jgi:hypothetical protein
MASLRSGLDADPPTGRFPPIPRTRNNMIVPRNLRGFPWPRNAAWLMATLAVCLFLARPVEPQLPPVTILEDRAGTAYFPSDESQVRALGAALAGGFDANGDGFSDLLAGAPGDANTPGRAFVILGGRHRTRFVELSGNEEDGITTILSTAGRPDELGAAVGTAGDVDGDGFEDFLIGAPASSAAPGGAAYLIFGKSRLPSRIALENDLAQNGLIFSSSRDGDRAGAAVAGVGDVNGDGFPDFAITAPGSPAEGRGRPGRLYLIFGGPALRAALQPGANSFDLSALPPTVGLAIDGPVDGGLFGASVAGAGDLDGDGLSDLVAGAPALTPGGAAFIVFGRPLFAALPDLLDPDGNTAARVETSTAGALLGAAVAGGRDVTGDQVPDLLLGAPGAGREGGLVSGMAVLLKGGALLHARSIDVTAGGPGLVQLIGGRDDRAGSSVALAPDTGGDSVDDILVGGPARFHRGAAYLINGGADLSAKISLSELQPPLGATLLTNFFDSLAGSAVAGLGDQNGDGRGDLAVGAPGLGREGGGAIYQINVSGPGPAGSEPWNLRCRVLPGRLVQLTWINQLRYSSLQVFRDGTKLVSLAGDQQSYVDTAPLAGQHTYQVQANDDARLTSNPCTVLLQTLPVMDLSCQQLPGTTRVRIEWGAGDRYDHLAIAVNGKVVRGDLSGGDDDFEIDLGPGNFTISVFDPENGPASAIAKCEVTVLAVPNSPLTGLTCAVSSGGEGNRVDLHWDPNPIYERYQIFRDQVPIAIEEDDSFRDENPPPGNHVYRVVGLLRFHLSPPLECSVTVPGSAGTRLEGRVAFADARRTPLAAGRVTALDLQKAVLGVGQPGADGRFEISISRSAPASVRFEVTLPPLNDDDPQAQSQTPGQPPPGHAITVEAPAALGAAVDVAVPLPVLAIAGFRENSSRWKSLIQALESQKDAAGGRHGALTFGFGGRGEIARSVEAIQASIDETGDHLERYLRARPAQVDLVAHGFSGLGARAYLHGLSTGGHPVRRLILLGVPNLGTGLAGLDAIAAAPNSFFIPGARGRSEDPFTAAQEQLGAYLSGFNGHFGSLRTARAHLVAGLGGRDSLDAVLGCPDHDGRVCKASALGGIPGAATYTTLDVHENLGKSQSSMDLISSIVSAPEGTQGTGGAMEMAVGEMAVGGGGALSAFSLSQGQVISGILPEAASAGLDLLSDTSGSIIIILNNELPGTLDFRVRTPAGQVIDPALAGALPGVDYHTFGDGEGHQVQSYQFDTGATGYYTALISNPGGLGDVTYSVQIYLDSQLTVEAGLAAAEIDMGSTTTVTAALSFNGAPVIGGAVEARVQRPDGGLETVALHDDGLGGDSVPLDGIYTGSLGPATVAGLYLVTVHSSGLLPIPFLRETTLELVVRSTAAAFTGGFTSGSVDLEPDGVLDAVWVDGQLQASEPGIYLVTGKLTDPDGNPVAQGGVMFSLASAGPASFRVFFEGADIFAARRPGPYTLKEIEILDGNRGFVLCQRKTEVLTTEAWSWSQFGASSPPRFVRGDANDDGRIDISDALTILASLFVQGPVSGCPESADTNGDQAVDITDAIYLLNSLFLGGPPPPPPSPDCGTAATPLGCQTSASCR